jgi:hypothetical protein
MRKLRQKLRWHLKSCKAKWSRHSDERLPCFCFVGLGAGGWEVTNPMWRLRMCEKCVKFWKRNGSKERLKRPRHNRKKGQYVKNQTLIQKHPRTEWEQKQQNLLNRKADLEARLVSPDWWAVMWMLGNKCLLQYWGLNSGQWFLDKCFTTWATLPAWQQCLERDSSNVWSLVSHFWISLSSLCSNSVSTRHLPGRKLFCGEIFL